MDLPWLLDSPRVTRWYYRDAPAAGSIVRYLDETYIDIVERVTPTQIWFRSGRALWRPYLLSRLLVWSMTEITARRGGMRLASPTVLNTPRVQLRPDVTVLPA